MPLNSHVEWTQSQFTWIPGHLTKKKKTLSHLPKECPSSEPSSLFWGIWGGTRKTCKALKHLSCSILQWDSSLVRSWWQKKGSQGQQWETFLEAEPGKREVSCVGQSQWSETRAWFFFSGTRLFPLLLTGTQNWAFLCYVKGVALLMQLFHSCFLLYHLFVFTPISLLGIHLADAFPQGWGLKVGAG